MKKIFLVLPLILLGMSLNSYAEESIKPHTEMLLAKKRQDKETQEVKKEVKKETKKPAKNTKQK
jgi:hypothetical protein